MWGLQTTTLVGQGLIVCCTGEPVDAAAEAAAHMRKAMTFEGLTVQLYESAEEPAEVHLQQWP